MKKFLSILTAVGLAASTSTSVISCNNSSEEESFFPSWIGDLFWDRSLDGDTTNTEELILKKIVENNLNRFSNVGVTVADLHIKEFQRATWEENGSGILTTQNQNLYQPKVIGEVPFKVYKLSKIDIELEETSIRMGLDSESRIKILNYKDLIDPKLEMHGNAGNPDKWLKKWGIDEQKGEIFVQTVKENDETNGWIAVFQISSRNGDSKDIKLSVTLY